MGRHPWETSARIAIPGRRDDGDDPRRRDPAGAGARSPPPRLGSTVSTSWSAPTSRRPWARRPACRRPPWGSGRRGPPVHRLRPALGRGRAGPLSHPWGLSSGERTRKRMGSAPTSYLSVLRGRWGRRQGGIHAASHDRGPAERPCHRYRRVGRRGCDARPRRRTRDDVAVPSHTGCFAHPLAVAVSLR